MRGLVAVSLVACSSTARTDATEVPPRAIVAPVAARELCVTHGALEPAPPDGGPAGAITVRQPTFRAVAPRTSGDAAELRFTVQGDSDGARALASGVDRRQIGLKLRAQDGCNVVYVMWRGDKRTLDVSVKHNPGMKTHAECGANGYAKVRTRAKLRVPPIERDREHVLRAEIHADELVAWIDGKIVWRGELPAEARSFTGPAGVRSDNLAFTASFHAPPSARAESCRGSENED